jgi:hypothetical protein
MRDQMTSVENENVFRYTSCRHTNKVSRSHIPHLDLQSAQEVHYTV